jgi:hypothetical protein
VKRDIDRARATVRQYTGNSIRVESDGKTVRFMSESMRLETSLLIAAGGAAASQITVVAGGMIRNYNGTQRRKISPSHEIFFDKRHIKQYRPINNLLI